MLPTAERFERHVRRDAKTKCWQWTGAIHPVTGYAQFRYNKKTSRAHRVAWEIYWGFSPGNLKVCHTCDNRSCVNPDHLFLGTQSDNIKDAFEKGRIVRPIGSDSHRAKLSDDDVRSIVKDARMQKEIAKEYGVKPSVISRIKTGRSWTHITHLDKD